MRRRTPTTRSSLNDMENPIKADIKQFEEDTGIPFRTAHDWDHGKKFYKPTVTSADICRKACV